jgi:hypothetical protein
MKKNSIRAAVVAIAASLLVSSLSACGANLCQRKDRVLTRKCEGTDVTYSPDTLCERNLDVCGEGKLRLFEQYVQCLEAINVCSLETINGCASKYPGGVNLQCAG